MRVTCRLQRGVEMCGILGIFDAGVQIGPTTEPPRVRRPEHPGVHMHRRGMRILHMGDKADARSPETRILGHAGHTARHLLDLDPEDMFGARLKLALLGAEETPDTPPSAYVEALWDEAEMRRVADLPVGVQRA